MTQHYYIHQLFAQQGLIGNEHFMRGLLQVCSITGCSAEAVLSLRRKGLAVYTRHLWFWLMKGLGFSESDIAEITGRERTGIVKAVIRLEQRAHLPYMQADISELRSYIHQATKQV